MADSKTALQTGYVGKESTYGTGFTFTNANAFRFIKLEGEPTYGSEPRPDKTGSYSPLQDIKDNKGATWSTSASLAGSGAAGTPPDIGPFLEVALGKQTIVAATSVTYDPDDTDPSLSIMIRDKPSSVSQLIVVGAIVQSMKLSLGPAIPIISFSGIGKWAIDSLLFSGNDTEGKAGYATFPTEPASPVVNGVPPRGRTGLITLDGNAVTNFRTLDFTLNTNKSLSDPVHNSAYPGPPMSDRRMPTFDLVLYDDDTAATTNLKTKALSGTPVNLSFQVGLTPGNIATLNVKNVLLPMPKYGWDDAKRTVKFNGCEPKASSASAKDEIQLVLT
jgi:hypothetical protein